MIVREEVKKNYTKVPNWIRQVPGLKPIDREFIWALHEKMKHWDISLRRLAKEMNVGYDQLRNSVNKLIKLGIIERDKKTSGKTTYLIHEPKPLCDALAKAPLRGTQSPYVGLCYNIHSKTNESKTSNSAEVPELFKVAYNLYKGIAPGLVGTLDVEYANYVRVDKDLESLVDLVQSIKAYNEDRLAQAHINSDGFIPNAKKFKNWINDRSWINQYDRIDLKAIHGKIETGWNRTPSWTPELSKSLQRAYNEAGQPSEKDIMSACRVMYDKRQCFDFYAILMDWDYYEKQIPKEGKKSARLVC